MGSKLDIAYEDGRFWPEPMIQLNPKFSPGHSVLDLVRTGDIESGIEHIFRAGPSVEANKEQSFQLHRHQSDAVDLGNKKRSFVVTTGTGSGKSICYFLPIINRILKTESHKKRTRAIVIYPMNALANSQLEEFNKRLEGTAYANRITARLYTGQQDARKREELREAPPDILLTNFMMLELLLTRQAERDRDILNHCEGLEFLVLDELHTYRGRQGADVAMLVRRLRQRLEAADKPIQCIGTSATMASDGPSSRQKVANVASTIFATEISPDAIVTETLERVTDPSVSLECLNQNELRRSVLEFDAGCATDQHLWSNLFMVWIELNLGLDWEDDGAEYRRAQPRDLKTGSEELAKATGLTAHDCRRQLETALETAGRPETGRGGTSNRPFFPVRLHRFISGAGRLFATIEPPGRRDIDFKGQVFLPGRPEKVRLFSTFFCRHCGQEHHPVHLVHKNGEKTFVARDIDDQPTSEERNHSGHGYDGEIAGFITPVSNDDAAEFSGEDSDYPEDWLEETRNGDKRLKRSYRTLKLTKEHVRTDGGIDVAGVPVWFQAGKFRFCLACRDTQSPFEKFSLDFSRLPIF